MKLYRNILLLSVFIITNFAFAQPSRQMMGGSITGTITDSVTNHSIEYANVVIFNISDNQQVNGTVTGSDGSFSIAGIKPGSYFIKIVFMGYQTKQINNIIISRSSLNVNLGSIKIKPSAINLNAVVIEGERAPVSYQIDKKVINVDQFPLAASGTAVDVLENVPSITVDIEGNVSLRGSGSFTVLIDGRPTILDPQDALQQQPASTIENIEIITNPSAKYNPEGTAGIINLVLKKSHNVGISGISNINAGLNEKYGGEILMELKNSFFSSNVGLDYNRRFFPGTGNERRTYYYQGSTNEINSTGSRKWGRTFYGTRAGINFNLSPNDLLGISGRYGQREMKNSGVSNFAEFNSGLNTSDFYINRNSGQRAGHNFSISSNFQHKFELPGHELTADFNYNHNDGEDYDISEASRGSVIFDGKKNTEDGSGTGIRGKIDYVLPFSEQSKFEAGTEGDFDFDSEGNGFYEYNTAENAYIFQPLFSYLTESTESQYAVYSIYSNMIDNFGYQAGVRGEYTYRNIEIPERNNQFKIDRWDYFPSVHLSYKFPTGQQLMASYSRRIQRPRGWSLEPFETWVDANTIRKGNPSLQPEFIDSYELGIQTFIGPVSISSEFYYRINNNKIEQVNSVYSENVTLQTFANIGKDYSFGNEILINTDIFDIWNINLMGNIYDYRMKGVLYNKELNRNSFNWRTRLNNIFRLGDFQLQLNAEYNSPSVSSQGTREGFFSTDAAIRTDFLNRQLSFILQVRDLFKTGKNEFTTQTPDFYSYSYFKRDAPIVMLTMKLSLNNYKQERERQGEENIGDYQDYQ
jgi:outer membrane receptor protein involved in Fe transport